jgi:arylsulfatase A-like enzyme
MSTDHSFTRRELLGAGAAALVAGALSRPGHAAPPVRPHMLWLMTDEHRWDAIRAYGGQPFVHSPNLDRLAAGGVLFQEAYCQAPACVASRVSIKTGRYPHHTGVYGFEYSHAETPFGVPFFMQRLHDSGYTVANFGKEHHFRLASKADPITPDGRWYRTLNAFADHDDNKRLDVEASPDKLLLGAEREHELGVVRRYLTEKKLIIAGRNPVGADQTTSARITDRALAWLRNEAPRNKPLLCRVSWIYPHTPILPPAPFDTLYDPASIPLPSVDDAEVAGFGLQTADAYRNLRTHGMTEAELRRMRAHYYGLAAYADQQLGRVIDGFKTWCGDQPWLILFTADHGCKLGEHGMHEKFTFYDASVRVPLIVASSDDRFAKGTVCRRPVELVDVAPTLLNAAGVALPGYLDGHDLAATAAGRVANRSEVISEKNTYGRRALLRDARWSFELMVDTVGHKPRLPTAAELRDRVRRRQLDELDVSLFDQHADPGQTRNLARDAGYRKVCEELRERLVARLFPEDRVEYPWWRDIPKLPNPVKG